MKNEQDVDRVIELYSDTVKRICMVHLKDISDTEDVFQNVFLKYILHSPVFETQVHEKAWVIRVTINECKDLLKSFFRKNFVPLDDVAQPSYEFSQDVNMVLESVLALPRKYKDVIYLFYYEGYSAVEISSILGKNTNTIYTLLARAKKILKVTLGGEEFGQ